MIRDPMAIAEFTIRNLAPLTSPPPGRRELAKWSASQV